MDQNSLWNFEEGIFRETKDTTKRECKEDYEKIMCILDNWVDLLNIVRKYPQDEIINSISAVFLLNNGKQLRWVIKGILSGAYFEAIRNLRFIFETIIWAWYLDEQIDEETKERLGALIGGGFDLKYEILKLKEDIYKEGGYNRFKKKEEQEKIIKNTINKFIEEQEIALDTNTKSKYKGLYFDILKNLGQNISGRNSLISNLPFREESIKKVNQLYNELSLYTHFSYRILEPIYEEANVDLIFNFSFNKGLFKRSLDLLLKTMDLFYAVLYIRFEKLREEIKNNVAFCEKHNMIFPITKEVLNRGQSKKNDVLQIAYEILEISPVNHSSIQSHIEYLLRDKFGFSVLKEYEVFTKRRGFVDLVAKREDYVIGVEIDRAVPKYKSIEKLNTIGPTISFIVLRSQINENKRRELLRRMNQLKTPYVVISLYHKKILLQNISVLNEEKIRKHSEPWLLGESDDPSAIPKLIELTKSKNANERRLAASGLGKLARYKPQIFKACPYLVDLLNDEKPQVRQYAAKALGKIRYVKALPHLRKLLEDEKYYVRKPAEESIKKCELEYERYKKAHMRNYT